MKRLSIFFVLLCLSSAVCASRPKVGLVLGGGGAKGAAEVGVLKVIERAGIPIDYIVGTSIGSIVGGLYATGYNSTELDTIMRSQEWLSLLTDRREEFSDELYKVKDGMTYIFGFPILDKNASALGSVGALRGKRIEAMLDSLMGYRGYNEFESLKIPFKCVACDFKTATEVVLDDGCPATAMRASMAIPGIFKPVRKGDMTLVDGGMMNNLPVDVVRQMGADIVIAIDLQQDKPKPRKKTDAGYVGMFADMLGIGGLINWIATRPDIRKYDENRKSANVYINPALPDYDASSFGNKNVARMIDIGEKAGMSHWNELLKLKERLK